MTAGYGNQYRLGLIHRGPDVCRGSQLGVERRVSEITVVGMCLIDLVVQTRIFRIAHDIHALTLQVSRSVRQTGQDFNIDGAQRRIAEAVLTFELVLNNGIEIVQCFVITGIDAGVTVEPLLESGEQGFARENRARRIALKITGEAHGDVAIIRQEARESQVTLEKDGKPAVELQLQRSENGNSLEAAKVLENWLTDTRPVLPPTVELEVYDETWQLLDDRISLLVKNGLGGLVLVICLLYLFLPGRVALWVAVGIPTAFLAAMAVLWLIGGSINMISLFGFLVVLGIVVDDAVVIVAAMDTLFGSLETTPDDDWMGAMQTNVVGTLHAVKAAVPLLRERGGGSVVLVGSRSQWFPPGNPQIAYASSKGALLSSMYHMVNEFGPDKIRVNMVVPTWMWGPPVQMYVKWQSHERKMSEQAVIDEITSGMPLGDEIPADEDVAEAILFFCSNRSRMITGETLQVHAGELLR